MNNFQTTHIYILMVLKYSEKIYWLHRNTKKHNVQDFSINPLPNQLFVFPYQNLVLPHQYTIFYANTYFFHKVILVLHKHLVFPLKHLKNT